MQQAARPTNKIEAVQQRTVADDIRDGDKYVAGVNPGSQSWSIFEVSLFLLLESQISAKFVYLLVAAFSQASTSATGKTDHVPAG